MIPLVVFLLACAAVYLGAIDAAFSALMRLSLRLLAERSDATERARRLSRRPDAALRTRTAAAGAGHRRWPRAAGRGIGLSGRNRSIVLVVGVIAFVVVFELAIPLLIVGRDPERVLEVLLPSFRPVARRCGRWRGGRPLRPAARRAAPSPPRRNPRRATWRGLPGDRRGGRDHRRRRAAPAPEHRGLRRHAGSRGHDAAPRHRRHPRSTPPSAICARSSASRSTRAFRSSRTAWTTSRASCS